MAGKEEPAWKAELRQDILNAAIAVNTAYRDHRVQPWTPMTDAVMATLEPHIEAAEQRGREAALRAMAAELRRTPRDSRDYPAALTGARLIEDALDSQ